MEANRSHRLIQSSLMVTKAGGPSLMLNTLYDARWIGNHGIGRFAGELFKLIPGMTALQESRQPWHPLDPAFLGATLWQKKPRLFFSPGYNPPLGWPKPFVFTLHDLNHLCIPENSNAAKRAYYKYIIRPACHRAFRSDRFAVLKEGNRGVGELERGQNRKRGWRRGGSLYFARSEVRPRLSILALRRQPQTP